MKVRVKQVEGLTFIAETNSGHGIIIDTKKEYGGNGLGPSPMELLLTGVAACTAFDIVVLLKKMREPVESVEVIAKAERRKEYPRIFTNIHLEYIVKGEVKEEKLKKAIELSQTKLCSASNNLKNGGTIVTYTYKILNDEEK